MDLPSMTPEHQPLKSNPEEAPDHVTVAVYSEPSPPSQGPHLQAGSPHLQAGGPHLQAGGSSLGQGPLPPGWGPPPPSQGPLIFKPGAPMSKLGPTAVLLPPSPPSRVWPTHLIQSAATH